MRGSFASGCIKGAKLDDPPTFCIDVPIGGSLEAIKSLESVLGIDLESVGAEREGASAGVETTLISTSKL